jgi:diguanylate cyclase (GGDEF)-like protein
LPFRRLEFSRSYFPGLWEFLSVTAIVMTVSYAGIELWRRLGDVPTIWAANGVLLAILLGVPRRTWPAYLLAGFAGSVAVMFLVGDPVGLAIGLPTANAAETIFFLASLRNNVSTVLDLSKPRVLLRFIGLAAGAAPLLSTSLIKDILYFEHINMGPGFFAANFLSHSLGLMTITPVVLAFRGKKFLNFFLSRKIWQALLVAVLLLGVTTAVFVQSSYPFLFMVYPPLVLVVCLFGLPGGALAIFVVTLISITFTVAGHGPVALVHTQIAVQRIIITQIFAGEAAILVLVLAAILADLDRARQELSEAKEVLAQLAGTDSLTGLANRRRLDEVLEQECRRAARHQTSLALLLIDVDNFKAYNDFYGHQAGDECLCTVSSMIAKFSRRPGDLTARYGGEELVVLFAEADYAAAMLKAEQIRLAVQGMALPHAGNAMHGHVVTVSIGISTYCPKKPLADPGALLRAADKMLYEAKRTGRNKSVWEIEPAPRNETPLQLDDAQR